MEIESNDLHTLVTEVRLLRTEFTYIKERLIESNQSEVEIYNRLREIENTLAVLKAQRAPKVSWWTITAVVITGLLALITFVEKVSL